MARKLRTAVVINDHQLITDLLSSLLREHNIEVVASFVSAEAGVAFVVANPPSLAVVEMVLPLLRTFKGEAVEHTHPFVLEDCESAFQAVREIRKMCPDTKTLMLTGEKHPHNFEMGFRAGAHGIASKHDGVTDLLTILHRVLAGETHVLSERVTRQLEEYLASPTLELTDTQVRILEFVQEGMESPEIGRQLGYSAKTIRNKLSQINQKLGTSNRFETVELVSQMGLLGWRR